MLDERIRLDPLISLQALPLYRYGASFAFSRGKNRGRDAQDPCLSSHWSPVLTITLAPLTPEIQRKRHGVLRQSPPCLGI